MKNWLFIIILAYLSSCTQVRDKEDNHQLGETVARQNLVIDSLKHIIQRKSTKKYAENKQASFASFPSTVKLYAKIEATEVKNFEFAEVLSIAEADTAFSS